LLQTIVERRLKNHVERVLPQLGRKPLNEGQYGFRRARSTDDAARLCELLIDRRQRAGVTTVSMFLDLRNAFGSCHSSLILRALLRAGVTGACLRFLRRWYEPGTTSVFAQFGRDVTAPVHPVVGTTEGCTFSPIVFNMFLNDVLCELDELGTQAGLGVPVTGERDYPVARSIGPATRGQTRRATVPLVTVVAYADDGRLLAGSVAAMQQLLDALGMWSRRLRLTFNMAPTKTAAFVTWGQGVRAPSVLEPLRLCGQDVPWCSEYKYLGHYVTPSGGPDRRHAAVLVARLQVIIATQVTRSSLRDMAPTFARAQLLTQWRPSYTFGMPAGVNPDALRLLEVNVLRAVLRSPYMPEVAVYRVMGVTSLAMHRRRA
jgi:hypothetical protein